MIRQLIFALSQLYVMNGTSCGTGRPGEASTLFKPGQEYEKSRD
jgi:hypothetical protein